MSDEKSPIRGAFDMKCKLADGVDPESIDPSKLGELLHKAFAEVLSSQGIEVEGVEEIDLSQQAPAILKALQADQGDIRRLGRAIDAVVDSAGPMAVLAVLSNSVSECDEIDGPLKSQYLAAIDACGQSLVSVLRKSVVGNHEDSRAANGAPGDLQDTLGELLKRFQEGNHERN